MGTPRVITWMCILAGSFIFLHCAKLKDELEAPTTSGVRVHPIGWKDSTSPNFHGTFLKTKEYDLSTCTPCHAKSFTGGTSGFACFTCHTSYPHTPGWEDSNASGFHGKFIRMSAWDMLQCRSCHGATYSGGRVESSCLTCHQKPNGPENCTTCHGGANAAPPQGINGDTARTIPGVGAHQAHLLGSSLASTVACSECHNVPSSVYQPGHISNANRAQVVFNGPLGTMRSAGGAFIPQPRYNGDSLTCGNTFCHGNWRLEKSTSLYPYIYTATVIAGNNHTSLWTGSSSQAACGSCHGLPPTGHLSAALSRCSQCHTGVVDPSGNIIDHSKHMNGKVNVFGDEYSF